MVLVRVVVDVDSIRPRLTRVAVPVPVVDRLITLPAVVMLPVSVIVTVSPAPRPTCVVRASSIVISCAAAAAGSTPPKTDAHSSARSEMFA